MDKAKVFKKYVLIAEFITNITDDITDDEYDELVSLLVTNLK